MKEKKKSNLANIGSIPSRESSRSKGPGAGHCERPVWSDMK